jgi:hypothetical protein
MINIVRTNDISKIDERIFITAQQKFKNFFLWLEFDADLLWQRKLQREVGEWTGLLVFSANSIPPTNKIILTFWVKIWEEISPCLPHRAKNGEKLYQEFQASLSDEELYNLALAWALFTENFWQTTEWAWHFTADGQHIIKNLVKISTDKVRELLSF